MWRIAARSSAKRLADGRIMVAPQSAERGVTGMNRLKDAALALRYYEQLVAGLRSRGGMDVVGLISAYEQIRSALAAIDNSELESAIESTRRVIEELLQREADLELLRRAKEKLEKSAA